MPDHLPAVTIKLLGVIASSLRQPQRSFPEVSLKFSVCLETGQHLVGKDEAFEQRIDEGLSIGIIGRPCVPDTGLTKLPID